MSDSRYFLLLLLSVLLFSCEEKKQGYSDEILQKRKKTYKYFVNPKSSPIPKNELKNFAGLNYFPIDSAYRLHATFEAAGLPVSVQLATSTEEIRSMEIAGKIQFTLNGQKLQLEAYRDASQKEPMLFVPFLDATSGEESYPSGRYLDLPYPKGKELILDFNLAYNPYCAYNPNYSCPVPPVENRLSIPIKAGERRYH